MPPKFKKLPDKSESFYSEGQKDAELELTPDSERLYQAKFGQPKIDISRELLQTANGLERGKYVRETVSEKRKKVSKLEFLGGTLLFVSIFLVEGWVNGFFLRGLLDEGLLVLAAGYILTIVLITVMDLLLLKIGHYQEEQDADS